MKVILTTGYEHSGYQHVHGILRDAGLAEAQPSRRERISAADLQVKLLQAFAESGEKPATGSPGRLWEELAVDLFVAQLELPAWGWADQDTTKLMDFWRRFDKQTRFVLVYTSPAFAIGQALQGRDATPEAVAQVVQAWSNQSQALLKFFRRFQGRCELINAVGALQAPAHLVDRLAERWGLSLQLAADYAPQRKGISAVAASLASSAVREQDAALSLYASLESCAGVTGERVGPAENRIAWNEYRVERQAYVAAQATVTELERRVRASSSEGAAHLEQQRKQVESVTKERDEQRKLVAQRDVQLQQLTSERDAQAKLAAERLSQLEALKKQAASPAATPPPSAKTDAAKLKELKEENDLLLLQLHQVQEELEHYYLQNQELLSKSTVDQYQYLHRFVRDNQPSEVVIDLRGDIRGENWYRAEEDGRWAGPQKTSSLTIPALVPGAYLLEIDIADAMTPGILANMEVHLNGNRIETNSPGSDTYPAVVRGRFRIEQVPDDQSWHIEFRFKDVMSPKQRGESDERELTVRFKSLSLILDMPALA